MFSELPKLFDRDFAIGYFLPVACFLASLSGLLSMFHHLDLLELPKKTDILVGTTLLGLSTWLLGMLLLAANRGLYQIFEGYKWPLNTRLGRRIEENRFKHVESQIDNAYVTSANFQKNNQPVSADLAQEQAELLITRAESFPYRERDILATRFGNTIRAFETYAKGMYGIDTIEGWLRLLAVVPKDYRQMIDSAKAQTDFWLNLWFLSYVTAGIYFILLIWAHHLTLISLWPLCLIVLVLLISRSAAIMAAKEWGAIFKSAFDVFLPELYEKLNFLSPLNAPEPSDNSPEWKTWDDFSKAITYRIPTFLPPRTMGQEHSILVESGNSENKSELEEADSEENASSNDSTLDKPERV